MSLFSSYPGKVAQAQRRRDLTWEGEQLNVNANLSLLGSSAPYCVPATSKKFKLSEVGLCCVLKWVFSVSWSVDKSRTARQSAMLESYNCYNPAGFAELLLDCFHIFLAAASVACRPCPAQGRKQSEKPKTQNSHAPEVKRLSQNVTEAYGSWTKSCSSLLDVSGSSRNAQQSWGTHYDVLFNAVRLQGEQV